MVKNLTLRYAPTARFARVGRNGSGKSSLIRVLLGLQRGLRATSSSPDTISITMIHARCVRASESSTGTRFCSQVPQARISPQGSCEPMTLASIARWHLPAREASSGSYRTGSRPSLRRTAAIYPADSASGIARAVVRDHHLVLIDEPAAFLDAEAAVVLEKRLAALGGGSAVDTCHAPPGHAPPGRGPQRRRNPGARSGPVGRARM